MTGDRPLGWARRRARRARGGLEVAKGDWRSYDPGESSRVKIILHLIAPAAPRGAEIHVRRACHTV